MSAQWQNKGQWAQIEMEGNPPETYEKTILRGDSQTLA